MRILSVMLVFVCTMFAQSLVLMTEEWTPYNYTKDGELKGIAPAVVRAIQKEIQDSTRIEVHPWNRAYNLTLTKSNHALFSMVRNESREKLFKWVGPISDNESYLFKKKGSPLQIKSLEDAKKVGLIGAGSQTNIDYIVLQSKGFTNLSTLDTQSNPITLIVNERVDLGGSNPITALFHLKKNGLPLDAIENTGVKVFSNPLYIAFNKDTDDSIIQKWQNALDGLKENGTLDTIKQKAFDEAKKDFGISP